MYIKVKFLPDSILGYSCISCQVSVTQVVPVSDLY